ncbi:esterase [Brenneria rubrifaciens]|uniref:Esterase n=1 Tax=Brenneria rubrifaciens TaxID=55213 RepID=A0A4P8QV40_9GAMM|nr:esterase [Brenneria rubrifaciens]QCR08015.1 esterase [Brenneria rubrifaciens]
MKLNYRRYYAHQPQGKLPVILIHGLFGNLDNLGIVGRELQNQHEILQIDLRNHGLSPRSPQMTYPAMAQDVSTLMDELNIERAAVIGHSMGGKVAMSLTALIPERLEKLVVIDIAPVGYQVRRHDAIFSALSAVTEAGITSRSDAAGLMRQFIKEEGVIQFLLKSFHQGEWRFNVPVLREQYENIVGWQAIPAWQGPILFIRGENSPYLDDIHRDALLSQFPAARAHVIGGAGHWVHSEKPNAVLRAIHRFLDAG